MRGLALESLRAAKQRRVEHLQENRGRPAFRLLGAAVAGEPARERLDQQAEGVALVTVVEPPDGQDRARRVGKEHRRVARGPAVGVEQPLAFPRGLRVVGGQADDRKDVRAQIHPRVEVAALLLAVGQAAARGLGVRTPRRPPCGATVATVGSEQVSSSIRPWSVTRWR